MAQVVAPYEATSTEQLSLSRGQLIMIRKKTDSGWWEGELQVNISSLMICSHNASNLVTRLRAEGGKLVGSRLHM